MKLPNRNLFNGDSTFLFFGNTWNPSPDGPFHESVLHACIDTLASGGIDTYLCNPNAQVPWYPSRVLPGILTGYSRDNREFFRSHYPPTNDTDFTPEMLELRLGDQVRPLNRYLDLAERGVDWVAEIAKACRRNAIAPWISMRMNDAHGASNWNGSYLNCALQKNPKYRLRGRPVNPNKPDVSIRALLNYEHPEVRDYYFAMARELVEDYDYEGLELDWTRTASCCEPGASQATCDTVTAWIADLRALTRKRAEAIGKPYPLGLRITPRLDQLKEIGLDVRAMAREGLIDFVCPSNAWQTTWDVPLDEMRRELGDDITIYGVVEDAPNWLDCYSAERKSSTFRLLSTSPELLRGNAAGKLVLGADGIETFNFYCSDEATYAGEENVQQGRYDALRDLHDLEKLRGQPKHYTFASLWGHYVDTIYEYSEQLPFVLERGWRHALRLPMCAEPASVSELVIQVVVRTSVKAPEVGVSFNGSWPNFERQKTDRLLVPTGVATHHAPENVAFNFRFDPARIKDGWNEIVIHHDDFIGGVFTGQPETAVYVLSVELSVQSTNEPGA